MDNGEGIDFKNFHYAITHSSPQLTNSYNAIEQQPIQTAKSYSPVPDQTGPRWMLVMS